MVTDQWGYRISVGRGGGFSRVFSPLVIVLTIDGPKFSRGSPYLAWRGGGVVVSPRLSKKVNIIWGVGFFLQLGA